MMTIIENLPAAVALTALVVRLYLGANPAHLAK